MGDPTGYSAHGPSMRRFGLVSFLLIGSNVAAGGFAVWTWHQGQKQISEPADLIVSPLSLPDMAALNSTPMRAVEVSAIRDQAVFYSARSFYQPPPTHVEVPAPAYELAGTLKLPNGKHLAFVKNTADRRTRTVHPGDELDGWQIQAIESGHVTIQHDEQVADLSTQKSSLKTGLVAAPLRLKAAMTGSRVLGGGNSKVARAGAPDTSPQPRLFQPPFSPGK
jgi:hypothetical protein